MFCLNGMNTYRKEPVNVSNMKTQQHKSTHCQINKIIIFLSHINIKKTSQQVCVYLFAIVY